jgi:hypothetical protein
MKKIWMTYFLTLLPFVNQAQLTDVYTNTVYRSIVSRVIESESFLEYSPKTLTIYQDYIEHEDFTDELFQKIQQIAKQSVTNRLTFETIFNKMLTRIEQYNTINSEYGEKGEYRNPFFDRLEVTLVSVLNKQAIFCFEYLFEVNHSFRNKRIFSVKNYYQVDLKSKKIQPFETRLASFTNEIPFVISEKLKRIYAIVTQKIDWNHFEKVPEKLPFSSFLASFDLKELQLIPYFSGAMLVIDEFSKSSLWVKGEEVQLFFNRNELEQIKDFLPYFNTFYNSKNILPFNQEVEVKQLKINDFNKPQNALNFVLKHFQSGKLQLELEHYSAGNDKFYKKEKFQFDNMGKVTEHLEFVADDRYQGATIYTYNKDESLKIKRHKDQNKFMDEVETFYYENGLLSAHETIGLDDKEAIWMSKIKSAIYDVLIRTTYYFYNGNYKHSMECVFLGKNKREYQRVVYLSGSELCSQYNCHIFDKNERVVGIRTFKHSSFAPQILTNEQGQLIEQFSDNDRQVFYYHYDEDGRLIDIKRYYDEELKVEEYFNYKGSSFVPFEIKRINQQDENVVKIKY